MKKKKVVDALIIKIFEQQVEEMGQLLGNRSETADIEVLFFYQELPKRFRYLKK